jgi:hypothetical protein
MLSANNSFQARISLGQMPTLKEGEIKEQSTAHEMLVLIGIAESQIA